MAVRPDQQAAWVAEGTRKSLGFCHERLVVTMPALYRPKILAATLWSFERALFRQFSHRTLILNVDPLGVRPEALRETREALLALAKRHFDEVITRFPQHADFSNAVHWLWGQAVVRQQHFLHLEDDWILNRFVPVSTVMALLEQADVGSVRLHRQRDLKRAHTPSLSLNPVFMNYRFISDALPMFRLDKDPEKQFQFEPLRSHLSRWQHVVIPQVDGTTADRGGWVSDIGVHWRKSQRLEKVAKDGHSFWRASKIGWLGALKGDILMRFKLLFYRTRLRFNLFRLRP